MNASYLPKNYRAVLMSLLQRRNSFIIQYPEPRPNNAHKWFFVEGPKSKQSQAISEDIGKYLVVSGWVEPELSDKEYQIQIALGSIDCRVYRIAPAAPAAPVKHKDMDIKEV